MLLPQDATVSASFTLASLFPPPRLCLSTGVLKNLSLGRRLSEHALFSWRLSLSNRRWPPESSCSSWKSQEWWLEKSEAGRGKTEHLCNLCTLQKKLNDDNREGNVNSLLGMLQVTFRLGKMWEESKPRCEQYQPSSQNSLWPCWLMPCEKDSSMVRRFSILPHYWQKLSSPLSPTPSPPCSWSMTPSNFLLRSHHRHPVEEGAEGRWAVIIWGSNTGCGQQRESSSDPLLSNPQSVLEQSWNSNSSAKQSTGTERSVLVLQDGKKKISEAGTSTEPCLKTNGCY